MVQTVWAFLLVLGVLIFVHELGHFLVARWFGVRVLTFSLGFGPKILKWTRGGTVYCISAIPLGGYVKMAGETTQDERVGAPDEFMSKSRWVRFLVYLAGPAMNVFLAIAALTIVLADGADVPLYNSAPAVVGVLDDNSVAASAGIRPGDRIVAVNGKDVPTWDDLSMAVLPKANRSIAVEIERQGAAPDDQRGAGVGDEVRVRHAGHWAGSTGSGSGRAGREACRQGRVQARRCRARDRRPAGAQSPRA